MKTDSAKDNTAVLIDADNISHKHIAGLLAEVANYGTVAVRRIYGDWTSPSMNGWRQCLLEHSIVPIQQFAYTTGKNATDGAMIIDAMDLLYTGRFASFCIVSSDSDFTRLAARIREQGVAVHGFGNRHNTHRAFIAACNEFIYLDALQVQPDEAIHTTPPLPQSPPARMSPGAPQFPEPSARREPGPRQLDHAAIEGLRTAISGSALYEEDYANLAEVGIRLGKISPDLNARNYGYLRLSDFVKASGIVELKMKPREVGSPIALVRLRV
ncbi:hypothetical protein DOTSEDRAFT_140534 [Dothistroma septosporum NZE10]|uniref:HTH OST-type domain-containing protein n=1 Tax=Dothistroma septosporum (strain NZE10 / CBS 128990) TaxID=675120 RepID=N1PBJ6_DOTSN|nr:hypothetical protein DOTSEDRAFT_140534 [Dothistroma septosporum NZE10]